MRRQIIAGNWKMHGSRAENAALVESIVHKLPNSSAEVWVCPPFVYLAELTPRAGRFAHQPGGPGRVR